jgi:3-phosphoshikimate 1-carboxyvinyltransferase
MGADVRVDGDTLVVRWSALTGAEVDSHHDHRIAMACAVAALVADGPTTIAGWDAVATSYPTFEADLDLLRGGT